MFDYYGGSIPATHKKETQNEDAFECKLYEDGCLVVAMADGVSGSGEGRRAAAEAVHLVHEAYKLSELPVEARSLFNSFCSMLCSLVEVPLQGLAQTTLTVVCFKPTAEPGRIRASFVGIGDTAILLAQDTPVSQDYPGTFLCYRMFGAPQPSVDSRVYAYVDLGLRKVVGRPLLGEFEVFPGDICLVHTDGIRDEYIRRTTNREHRFLLDVKRHGARKAVEGLLERVRPDVGDDATVAAVFVPVRGVKEAPRKISKKPKNEEKKMDSEEIQGGPQQAATDTANSVTQGLTGRTAKEPRKFPFLKRKRTQPRNQRPTTRRR